jgi:hypothetical protein
MIKIHIPDGEASIRTLANEVSPRRRREIELIAARLGQVLPAVQSAARILVDGDVMDDRSKQRHKQGPRKGKPVFTGADVDLTVKQLRLLSDLNDAIVWSLLDGWTLDLPLPRTPDDLLDLPGDVYDALREQCSAVYLGIDPTGGFGPGALPEPGSDEPLDTTSPTSA